MTRPPEQLRVNGEHDLPVSTPQLLNSTSVEDGAVMRSERNEVARPTGESHIRLSSLRVTSSDNCTFIEEEIGSFVGPISLGCEIPFDPGLLPPPIIFPGPNLVSNLGISIHVHRLRSLRSIVWIEGENYKKQLSFMSSISI
ncbi:hypothetical protein SUGI_1478240 [Cryptomeria japonica]|uniref:Uncharacterized protein n=1 Tax=Cryptomeria japonica TaxID=3369 RepID=A0AAD3NTW7_CRYJA|nr:hypothetical protein SUGI_1478240 [Cryptomeria japonica]